MKRSFFNVCQQKFLSPTTSLPFGKMFLVNKLKTMVMTEETKGVEVEGKVKNDTTEQKIAGKVPLAVLKQTGWKDGQKFSLRDDPDRCSLPHEVPEFMLNKKPESQHKHMKIEQLDCSNISKTTGRDSDYVAMVVHNVLTPAECASLIAMTNTKG